METPVLLVNLGLIALAINRLIELLKPAIGSFPEEYQGLAIRFLSILIGVIITVGGGEAYNLLAISPVYGQLNPTLGLVITGVIVGAFSNGWDKIASLFNPSETTTKTESLTIEKTSKSTEKLPDIG